MNLKEIVISSKTPRFCLKQNSSSQDDIIEKLNCFENFIY